MFRILIPIGAFFLCLWNLYKVLYNIYLTKNGKEAVAKIEKLKYTVFFGQRKFLMENPNKPDKEYRYGCDYIMLLSFKTEDGREISSESCVNASIKKKDGKEFRYFEEGNSIPLRYNPKKPKDFVVTDPQVQLFRKDKKMAFVWGLSSLMLMAIIITIFEMI